MSDELTHPEEQRERLLLKSRVNAYFARWETAHQGDNDPFGNDVRRMSNDAHRDLVPNLLKALEAEEAKVIAARALLATILGREIGDDVAACREAAGVVLEDRKRLAVLEATLPKSADGVTIVPGGEASNG